MKIISRFTIFFAIVSILACKIYSKPKNNSQDSTQEAMLKALKWQELNPIFAKSPTDWTNGAYYLGVVKAHESTKNKAYLDALQSMAMRNDWKPWERFYHADDLNICFSYLYLNSLGSTNVNLDPTINIIKDHLYKPHPWKNGLNGTSKENNELGGKPTLWWWCDALFMAPPVITSYSNALHDESYLKEMDQYYKQAYELLYDKDEHLFSRDDRFLWTGNSSDIKEENGKSILVEREWMGFSRISIDFD